MVAAVDLNGIFGRFVVESDATSEKKGIHPVDLVLMLVVISFATALVLLDRFAIPAYAKMYQDFATELPAITRAVISHVVPLAVAATAVVMGALGIFARWRGSNTAAVSLGLAGIAMGLGGVVFCFYALYAPMFELAGKIKP
jgi:type II secretory pathway component PulF